MKKNLLIWTIKVLVIAMAFIIFPTITNANDEELDVEGFEIMPKLTWWQIDKVNQAISWISSSAWEVRKRYNEEAKNLKTGKKVVENSIPEDKKGYIGKLLSPVIIGHSIINRLI